MMSDNTNELIKDLLTRIKAGSRNAFCIQVGENSFVSNGRVKLSIIKLWIKLKSSDIHQLIFDNQKPYSVEEAEYTLLIDDKGSKLNLVRFALLKNCEPIVTSLDNAIGEIYVIAESNTQHVYGISAVISDFPSETKSKLISNGDREFIELMIHYADAFYGWRAS